MLALTGQVDVQVLGPGAFQEVDLAGRLRAGRRLVSQTVLPDLQPRRADDARAASTRCCERDVAHLIFPDDVQTLPAPDGATVAARRAAWRRSTIAPPAESLDARARRCCAGAKRPVIIVGHGARDRHGRGRSRWPSASARR